MSFKLRSRHALTAAACACLLAACDIKLTLPPVGPTSSPSASPIPAATAFPSPRPSTLVAPTTRPTVAPPNGTPDPNATPHVLPTPVVGPSPTVSPTVDPNATPTPVPGQPGNLVGRVLEVLQLSLKSPYDVAVDPDGNLWVTTPNETNALHKLGPDGKVIASYSGRGGVDVGVDAQGHIWTCSNDTRVIDRATGEVLASYPVSSSHLAFDAAGAAWTTAYFNADLIKFGPNGVKAETFSLAPRDWNGGMAFDPEGNVWVTGRKSSNPQNVQEILKVSPAGDVLGRFPELAMSIAFGPDKCANIVVNNTVRKLDLNGKEAGTFAFGSGSPSFVDIAPDGQGNWLLLDNSGARLYRVTL